MRRISAIAVIAIRSAVRSRVVLVLLCLLMLAVLGLPLTVKGDGSVQGFVHILLNYTMGAVSLILAIATLWAGCAAMSLEIMERQMHLVVTKPVRKIEIWLGKWLGLLAVNAILLSLSGVAVYGLLRWTTRSAKLSDAETARLQQEILVARARLQPDPVPVDERARELTQQRLDAGDLPAEAHPDDVFRAIRETLLRQAFTVPPKAGRAWILPASQNIPTGDAVLIRFKFSSSEIGSSSVPSRWRVGTEQSTAPYEVKGEFASGVEHSFLVPPGTFQAGVAGIVEYVNESTEEATVIFDHEEGMQFLVRAGSFEMNLVRGLLIVFFKLALLGALGLTAGTLLSMPVAAFMSVSVLALVSAGKYIQTMATREILFGGGQGHHHGHAHDVAPESATLLDFVFGLVFRGTDLIIRPLQVANPFEALASGLVVSWGMVGWVGLIQFVLYAGILAAGCSWLFNRKEVGLPL